jgi:hypothetical protein
MNEQENIDISKLKELIKIIDGIKYEIHNENLDAIKKLNTKNNKKLIEKFHPISGLVEDSLFNSISDKILENDENEKLIYIMEECIFFSNHNETLKHQFSNYVTDYCISKVNDDKINYFDALPLMKVAYSHSPDNPKIVKNFITLINYNLLDLFRKEVIHWGFTVFRDYDRIDDRDRALYKILDWVKDNMSQKFKQNSDALSESIPFILEQLEHTDANISFLTDDKPISDLLRGSLYIDLKSNGISGTDLTIKRILIYLKELS